MRACQDQSPHIDGRTANCNLAAFGAQKNYPSTTPQRGWKILNNFISHMLCDNSLIFELDYQFHCIYINILIYLLLLLPAKKKKIAGMEKFRSSFRTMAPVPYQGTTTSTYFHQQVPHYAFPQSAYG